MWLFSKIELKENFRDMQETYKDTSEYSFIVWRIRKICLKFNAIHIAVLNSNQKVNSLNKHLADSYRNEIVNKILKDASTITATEVIVEWPCQQYWRTQDAIEPSVQSLR